MKIDLLLSRLKKVRQTADDRWGDGNGPVADRFGRGRLFRAC